MICDLTSSTMFSSKELTKDILPAVLPSIKKGLQDDDVRAVAAATLVPVASELVSLMPNEVCVPSQ